MRILETIHSKVDNTVKYVFLSTRSTGKDIVEISYINKNDGKDIICVPTQTSCNLGCKFCFLSELNIPIRNLTAFEMYTAPFYINIPKKNKVLLVSFMGCGEPLNNIENVIEAMVKLRSFYKDEYETVRFAVASLVPRMTALGDFLTDIHVKQLDLKFHYSLHSPKTEVRQSLMPLAYTEADKVISALREHCNSNKQLKVEIHYSLMKGANDTYEDAKLLSKLIPPFPIKILKLSEKESNALTSSPDVSQFRAWLDELGVENEYYEPPGADVGASCGQFLLDYYKKYGIKNEK